MFWAACSSLMTFPRAMDFRITFFTRLFAIFPVSPVSGPLLPASAASRKQSHTGMNLSAPPRRGAVSLLSEPSGCCLSGSAPHLWPVRCWQQLLFTFLLSPIHTQIGSDPPDESLRHPSVGSAGRIGAVYRDRESAILPHSFVLGFSAGGGQEEERNP